MLRIDPGPEANDYQVGHILSAVDELISYYYCDRGVALNRLADALELYARHLREDAR